MAAWNEPPAAGGLGECAALVRSAEALRFSAPELAVQLARRALIIGAESSGTGDVGQAKVLSMRAQAVLAAGLVRMSHYTDAVEPGFAALALAEVEGVADVAMSVRLDLAACSREVGEPLLGCAVLRPVLDMAQPKPSVRAVALGRLVGCVAHVGRRDDIEDVLTEADRLLAADDGLSPDLLRLERARLSVRAAVYHRWYGDTEDAAEAAREGLTQLNRLRGLRSETARLRAQLVLELACALLDEGALEEAASVSEAVLAEPVRATSAAAVGRLMLAVSTRVHLPAGRVDRGRGLLDQAVWVAGRHGLDGLQADALTAVSQLDETAGHPVAALESLHGARAAEQRRLRAVSQAARRVLIEANPAQWNVKAVNTLLRSVVRAAGEQAEQPEWHLAARRVTQSARQHAARRPAAVRAEPRPAAQAEPTAASEQTLGSEPETTSRASGQAARTNQQPAAAQARPPAAAERADERADTDEATGLLNKEGLIRRLRSVRNGERPVALTLVRLDGDAGPDRLAVTPPDTATDFELSELAGRVRTIVPDDAELARSDGAELAVLLPHTTRDQAEKFAAAIESAWLRTENGNSISTGVVQSNPDIPTVDARALINAARHALTPAVAAPSHPRPAPQPTAHDELADLADLDAGDTLRIGRAIIGSLSIPTGSGGKRRAPEPPASPSPNNPKRQDDTGTAPADARDNTAPGNTNATDSPQDAPRHDPHKTEALAKIFDTTPTDDATPAPRPDDRTANPPHDATPANAASNGPAHGDVDANAAPSGSAQGDADVNAGSGGSVDGVAHREVDAMNQSVERYGGMAGRDVNAGFGGSVDGVAHREVDAMNQPVEPSDSTAGRDANVTPLFGESGGDSERRGTWAEAAEAPTSTAHPDTTKSPDSSGGATFRETREQNHTGESKPGDATEPADASSTYTSSTYEQTKAELSRLMSALATGSVHAPPDATDASPTFASTPLPAPAHPVEDRMRNGTAVPRQSIPTPPDPDEIPEPPRRPDIPDPDEPEPIPPAPPDPGPPPPDEPGPLTPPSAGRRVSRLAAAFGAGPDRAGSAPHSSTTFGGGTGTSADQTGGPGRPAAGDTSIHTEAADRPPNTSNQAGTPDQAPATGGTNHTAPAIDAPASSFERDVPTGRAPTAGSADGAARVGDALPAGAERVTSTAGAERATTPADAERAAVGGAAGRAERATDSGRVDYSGGRVDALNPTGDQGAGNGAARGRRSGGRRSERSSDSTTIAGLLAEALAAYQETADEPSPNQRASNVPEPTRSTSNQVEPVRPATMRPETNQTERRESDDEFGRLFDWRYQSPASGRHRSPE